jgi:hypothetical protein
VVDCFCLAKEGCLMIEGGGGGGLCICCNLVWLLLHLAEVRELALTRRETFMLLSSSSSSTLQKKLQFVLLL